MQSVIILIIRRMAMDILFVLVSMTLFLASWLLVKLVDRV
jgi:hypothetical protein